jgi:hypothetical protein
MSTRPSPETLPGLETTRYAHSSPGPLFLYMPSAPEFCIRVDKSTRLTGKQIVKRGGRGIAESCTPGKAQCAAGLGCYGCDGHDPVCQPGPGSGECCFREDIGPTCQVQPIGRK